MAPAAQKILVGDPTSAARPHMSGANIGPLPFLLDGITGPAVHGGRPVPTTGHGRPLHYESPFQTVDLRGPFGGSHGSMAHFFSRPLASLDHCLSHRHPSTSTVSVIACVVAFLVLVLFLFGAAARMVLRRRLRGAQCLGGHGGEGVLSDDKGRRTGRGDLVFLLVGEEEEDYLKSEVEGKDRAGRGDFEDVLMEYVPGRLRI